MLLEIGRRRPPAGPADLLVECHGRIRHFLKVALRLSESEPIPLTEAQEAARRVRRYFLEALPLHIEDEEELIAPLLRGSGAAIAAALERMAEEHHRQQGPLHGVLEVCEIVQTSPEYLSELRDELRRACEALQDEFIPHLEEEERTIFPALRCYLSEPELDAVMVGMRLRRERHLERGSRA